MDNIKMDLREISCEGGKRVDRAQDRVDGEYWYYRR
jgi:hypothetical protein